MDTLIDVRNQEEKNMCTNMSLPKDFDTFSSQKLYKIILNSAEDRQRTKPHPPETLCDSCDGDCVPRPSKKDNQQHLCGVGQVRKSENKFNWISINVIKTFQLQIGWAWC